MDGALECIAEWMPRQRWYAGKGRAPELRLVGQWALPSLEQGVDVMTLLLMDDASRPATLYQVPVTRREVLLPGADHRLIGPVVSGDPLAGGHLSGGYLYDAPHDPAYTAALLEMILEAREAVPDGVTATGLRSTSAGDRRAEGATARVLEGEQSNTSIIYETTDGGPPIIVKVFRQLHHGDNPDVTLQTALAEGASVHVPPSVGAVVGQWKDVGRVGGRASGHLAVAQEFLPGAVDAWRVGVRSAETGTPFVAEARAIGRATAAVHRSLAEVFDTHPATPAEIAAVVSGWHERLAAAASEIPELSEHRAAIERAYDRARGVAWPALQRVHGDLHLGQVLAVPGRAWMIIDFEGEPLRPMADRVRPDVALRDVAGMLRSFDYVAGSVGMQHPTRAADELAAWAAESRSAFLRGYDEESVTERDGDDHALLLGAFELDKAVYEALYERRNRQHWLAIPLLGIMRILDRSAIGHPAPHPSLDTRL